MPDLVKLLFIGDIFGKSGREIIREALPALIKLHEVDLVVANVENAAGGNGITRDIAEKLLGCGIQVMTTGNHVWDKKEALTYIKEEPRLLRPANYPPEVPGRGRFIAQTNSGVRVGIVNVMGRVFMNPLDNPFTVARNEIAQIQLENNPDVILVDMHAEATSEKQAMGWHLDGTVTAVVGTHTHVQTADERILPNGTAYITDVGMTGPYDSIIGVDVRPVLKRFLDGLPARFEPATGPARLNAVLITANSKNGRSTKIERVNLSTDDIDSLTTQP